MTADPFGWSGPYSAADLQRQTFPPPRWAVPDLLAEGVNVLAGPPKLGKSWFALGVGIAVAGGGRALDAIDVEQGDVLYLALEDTPRRLYDRMRMLCGSDPWPEALALHHTWPGHTEGHELLDGWLHARPGARLVVVDVFQKVRPHMVTNQSAYAADYAAVAPLMDLARAHQVCVLVVHHTRKASADDFLDTVSGTNGIVGSADATLVLSRSRNEADATLSITGRDVEERSHALALSHGRWRLLDGSAERYDLSPQRRAVIDLVRDHGPLAPKAIAAAIAHDHEATKKLCQRMAIDGQLSTDGSGRYTVPTESLSLASPESPAEGHRGPEGQGGVVPDA